MYDARRPLNNNNKMQCDVTLLCIQCNFMQLKNNKTLEKHKWESTEWGKKTFISAQSLARSVGQISPILFISDFCIIHGNGWKGVRFLCSSVTHTHRTIQSYMQNIILADNLKISTNRHWHFTWFVLTTIQIVQRGDRENVIHCWLLSIKDRARETTLQIGFFIPY